VEHASSGARPVIRDGAERYLLLVIVSFVVAVVGTRWFLQATGYPQVGGGELHIAHMLWGGLALVVAALLSLVVTASWVAPVTAILTGAGTGLFIDEVGKFITASNDYFYPLAAPLIYGLLLVLALVFIVVSQRDRATAGGQPARVSAWETAHLPRRRYRSVLVALLLVVGLVWLASLLLFLALDTTTLNALIESIARVPGDRVERPTEPAFYLLEVAILGAGGLLLVTAAILLARGREGLGIACATVGLVVALTAGAIVSLYVEQVSAIGSTIWHAALLLAVLHYRSRLLANPSAGPAAAQVPGHPSNPPTESPPT
jgi:hypothetical protein